MDVSGGDPDEFDVICDTTVWVQQFNKDGMMEEQKITTPIRRVDNTQNHPDLFNTPMSNPQTKTFVGAYWGNDHHFNGMLYFIEYNLAPTMGSDLEYIPDLTVCSNFHADAHFSNGMDSVECPSRCAIDEFVNEDGQCCACHDTCVYGCSDEKPCMDCHADCLTCNGISNT